MFADSEQGMIKMPDYMTKRKIVKVRSYKRRKPGGPYRVVRVGV